MSLTTDSEGACWYLAYAKSEVDWEGLILAALIFDGLGSDGVPLITSMLKPVQRVLGGDVSYLVVICRLQEVASRNGFGIQVASRLKWAGLLCQSGRPGGTDEGK